ncbi:protein-L-isoaspartate(D-aspartate) O-methyltransferase [Congregicoccus parvus]|uniref:protein-L-isoaspartate(D-aspartate) O-methyltransferase n=1 Tax=Congregicoccus parvus TaxID=3081749 RepID=UPI003FA5D13A
MAAATYDPRPAGDDPSARDRRAMVARQIAARGVRDPRVLEAMRRVPRHRFVDPADVAEAYSDGPLPIGGGQTISQPYIVAYMIEALEAPVGGRILEVGTGLGYQAAVLAEAGFEVHSIELRPDLAHRAAELLADLGYGRVHLRMGDGSRGWPEAAPFDGIVVAAAAEALPEDLLDQLALGAALVIPVGGAEQTLWRYRRTFSGFRGEELFAVRFVPLRRAPL